MEQGSVKASIHLRSVIDGDEAHFEYPGEYRKRAGNHCAVYTDYAGNTVTKVSIEASDTRMLLHRVGGITADMLFDPATETIVTYDALSLRHGFLLRTDALRVLEEENQICILVEYSLNDGSDQPGIVGIQEITIKRTEDEDHEKLLSMLLAGLLLLTACAGTAFAAELKPGTYEGSAVSVGGPIRVAVTVDGENITGIEILEIHDSEGVYTAAAQRLPAQILEHQSVNVDGVTGATLSSLFIRNAVKDALSQAGDASAFSDKSAGQRMRRPIWRQTWS